jgi:hypothetical protein
MPYPPRLIVIPIQRRQFVLPFLSAECDDFAAGGWTNRRENIGAFRPPIHLLPTTAAPYSIGRPA